MTEEEKKAIEHLKFLKENFNPPNYVWFLKDVEALDVILNLINKQQKEIEELKEEVKRQGNTREIEEEFMEKNYISKDKIREKIKELEEDIEIHNIYEENWNKINVLKELLEE